MFLINNEILSKREHPEEYEWLQEKLKEIAKSERRYITFKAYQHPTYQVEAETGRKAKTPRIRVISAESVLINEEMDMVAQTWAYFPYQTSLKNENGMYVLRNKGMRLDGVNTYDTKNKSDQEIIFYLRHVSQNRFVVEVDEEKASREKAEKIANETEAKSLIYSSKSPVHPSTVGTEDAIRNLAATWSVPITDDSTLSEIQNALWDRVELGQLRYAKTKRGYVEFIQEALKLGDGSKRTTIILGIQKGTLEFGDDNLWYLNTKGGTKQAIAPVFPGQVDKKEEVLITALVNNDTAYEMVERAVADGDNSVLTDKLGSKSYQDMKDEAHTRLGWPKNILAKTKKEALEEILEKDEKYKE